MLNQKTLANSMASLMKAKARQQPRDGSMSIDDRIQDMADAISEAMVAHIQQFLEITGTGVGAVTGAGVGSGIGGNLGGPIVTVVNTAVAGSSIVTVPPGGIR